MFDNKIDWVTQLESRFVRREAHGPEQDSDGVTYKAEHELGQVRDNLSGECSELKSVFRSATRERVSASELFSGGFIRRLTSIRTEVIRLPALELILWSSY